MEVIINPPTKSGNGLSSCFMYYSTSRKYRPQTFAEICGQQAVVTTLKNGLKLGRIAHAYIFCGSRGTGKTTLARLLAKALNCNCPSPEGEPCNQCPGCADITSGRSLDVLEIDGASNRGIDDIRQINETVAYASSSGRYKIYIIDEVHMLTKEAFNALLKTLEEPPPKVKFFLATTEPQKVPPTILSRCQRFDLSRIPTDQIVKKLSKICQDQDVRAEASALERIAHQAEGGLRDAESMLDQLLCYAEGPITDEAVSRVLGLTPKSIFFQLDQAIASGNLTSAFDLARQIFSSGKDLGAFLEGAMEHVRTLLLHKLGQPLPEHDREAYAASSALYTEEQCLYNLDYLIQAHKDLPRTPFKRISLESILLHLIRNRNRIPIETIVRRLKELETLLSDAPSLPRLPEKKIVERAPDPLQPKPQEILQLSKPVEAPIRNLSRHETVMRFAAVELEGTLKKE